jgi:hypothetical protein
VVLRVKGFALATRTLHTEPADITLGHGEAAEADHSTRVAREALAAALRAAVVTCDRDKDIFPRIEAHIAQGTVPALVISSSSRRGSATEDRVEVVEAEGSKVPAAINPKLLLDAVETARVLGDDTDLRLAWQAFRSGSAWATSPSGYSLEDAPWWVTTMGLTR